MSAAHKAMSRRRLRKSADRFQNSASLARKSARGGILLVRVCMRRAGARNAEVVMALLIQVLQFALPAVIVIATLEGLVLAAVMQRSYNWRAWLASLADALGRQYFVMTFLPLSLAAPAIDFAWSHRMFTVPLNSAVAVVLLVIAQDFSYYWFHRSSHRVRWFWATHAIHHSSNEFNLAAAYRFGWTGRLTGTGTLFASRIWAGLP